MFPQPSPAAPHMMLSDEQLLGVHEPLPHWPAIPLAPQVPEGQAPQLMALPQPSLCMPHWKPCCVQVFGVQPVRRTSPLMQAWPEGHRPHWRMLPQPSPIGPQVAPAAEQVVGVQVGAPGVTHEARSKSMNSRSFSCGVIAPAVHSVGK